MDPEQCEYLGHLVEPGPDLRVQRFEPNFNHLALSTLENLAGVSELVCTSEEIEVLFKLVMRKRSAELTTYVNPAAIVSSRAADDRFLKAAVREKNAWRRRLRDSLHGSARTQRHFGFKGEEPPAYPPVLRELEFHGVLILAGRHVPPHQQWSALTASPPRKSLVGRSFGQLVVEQDLPRMQHRCRCVCGRLKIANRNHLLAGRTSSCGCLAIAKADELARRREHRAR